MARFSEAAWDFGAALPMAFLFAWMFGVLRESGDVKLADSGMRHSTRSASRLLAASLEAASVGQIDRGE